MNSWYEDEFDAEQVALQKEILFALYTPHPWVDKEFHCSFHPVGTVTKVYHVANGHVEFGWLVSGQLNIERCTIEEFKRDFKPIQDTHSSEGEG